jgi:hypothetical protein
MQQGMPDPVLGQNAALQMPPVPPVPEELPDAPLVPEAPT